MKKLELSERLLAFCSTLKTTHLIQFIEQISEKYQDVYFHIINGNLRVFCQVTCKLLDEYWEVTKIDKNFVITQCDNVLDIEQ